ncbi:MAG: hypothetical protein Q8O67_16640 [Deltaproteobacteria bacterium]|nr:hypothetical protein [Deltaproteobacteria bacterium]
MSVDVDDAFLLRLARGLSKARGNDRFPKTRPLSSLAVAWAQARAVSPGSVPAPVVDVDSGLPPWMSWAALLAERDLGATLPPAAQALDPLVDDARGRLLRREMAARALAAVPGVRLLDVDVVIRRIEPGKALLTLVLDRTDAGGLFVRITVDAWVPLQVGSHDGLVVDEDRARASAGLKDLLSLASHLPAPALLVRAATLPGVEVERLCRGVVGPLSTAKAGPSIGDNDVDAFALVLSSEELSWEIANTSDNDVFATDDLGAMMAALPKKLQRFRAFRDAKAVASPSSSKILRARAKERGLRTVLHEL